MPHRTRTPSASSTPATREGLTLSRRNLLKAGLAGVGGLTLPALLRSRANAARRGARRASSCCGWPAGRARSTPGPQARPAAREPRAVRRHQDEAARRPRLRAPAEARGDARPLHGHPLGRLPAQQPRAEHGHADGEPARRAAHQPRGRAATPPSARSSRSSTAPNHPAVPPTSRSCGRAATSPSAATSASSTTRSSPTRPRSCRSTTSSARTPGSSPAARCSSCRPTCPPTASATGRRCCRASTACAPTSTRPARWTALDHYGQQAVEMLTGGRVRDALDLAKEPPATRERYGKHLWCQQALLARRLVEAGRRVRHARPELPHRVGHLGHARRQHPALRRHQEGPRAAAAAVRPPHHDAGRRPATSAACSTRCW